MANEGGPRIDKGDRVRVTKGPAEGVTGTVFWKGENKYGPGDRFGIRGDDGQTHWIDGASVAPTDAAVPAGPELSRGDRVAFQHEGEERFGTVFWTGQSRHGPGQRLGVNPDGAEGRDDAVWIDSLAVRLLDADADPAPPPPRSRGRGPYQDDRDSGSGGWDGGDDYADIPGDYRSDVRLDELPPPAPWDDGVADQMATETDDDDGAW